MTDPEAELTFKPVDKSAWPDFEQLFESRGGPKYCWCMAWRDMPKSDKKASNQDRKNAIEGRVAGGVPIGILAYADGAPVAWCSIAPRPSYRKGIGGVTLPEETPDSVWSLACFFVSRPFRERGITRQLVDAAFEYAKANGAETIEAYPVDPNSRSYKFMGIVGSFRKMGFEQVGRAGSRRYVYRRGV